MVEAKAGMVSEDRSISLFAPVPSISRVPASEFEFGAFGANSVTALSSRATTRSRQCENTEFRNFVRATRVAV
ncbi:hypothetical protein ACWDUN_16995 [Mycobacterium sp. NPDC003323]